MPDYCLFRTSKHQVLRRTHELVAQGWADCAELLAHLGEVDARGLYRDESCDSAFEWCVRELHFSEGAAYRRITAARTARKFPVLFPAVAEGRLHLTAILLLAPYLTSGNVNGLVAEATHKSKLEIEKLLARRFPRPDVPTFIRPIPGVAATAQLAPARVEQSALEPGGTSAPSEQPEKHKPSSCQLAPARVELSDAAALDTPISPSAPRTLVKPLAPERYELRMTLDQETHDLLREAQDLLSHVIPGREAPEVLKRVLREWVQAQRRRKFGVTDKPRKQRVPAKGRRIPAAIKRAVIERDGGSCTFVGANNHRCGSRVRLEFDHIQPVARGGRTCVENLRLRCREHNQYEGERLFGAGFMREKREGAGAARPT
jgi:5-methylcytosine-specific restriction endonuclease McrA